MMKIYIRSTFAFMTISLFNGCADLEENSIFSEQNNNSPEGLENLEVLSFNDQRLTSALQSLDEQLSKKTNERLASLRKSTVKDARLYSYQNGSTAVAFSFDDDDKNIFTQILSPVSGKEVDFIHVQMMRLDPVNRSRTSITFKSLKSEHGFSYNPTPDNSVYGWKSWGFA